MWPGGKSGFWPTSSSFGAHQVPAVASVDVPEGWKLVLTHSESLFCLFVFLRAPIDRVISGAHPLIESVTFTLTSGGGSGFTHASRRVVGVVLHTLHAGWWEWFYTLFTSGGGSGFTHTSRRVVGVVLHTLHAGW